MSPKVVYMLVTVAAASCLAAIPADAQERRGEGRERARARSAQGGTGERDGRERQAVRRPAGGRQTSAAQQAPRPAGTRSAEASRQAPQYSAGRRSQLPQAGDRGGQAAAYSAPQGRRSGGSQARPYQGSQGGYGGQGQRATTRGSGGYQAPAYRADDRQGYSQPGSDYGRYQTRSYARPSHFQPYRPLHFSRPYYGFRPHVHIGFGVWLGVSVPYPWAYFGAYRPRVYGYYSRGYYAVAPGVREYGGLSFDIQPADADLFVDGEYVGAVGTFTPWGEPLTLWPGVHRVAIVRDGFRTMEFDVTVQPGQVIPYRGMLVRW